MKQGRTQKDLGKEGVWKILDKRKKNEKINRKIRKNKSRKT